MGDVQPAAAPWQSAPPACVWTALAGFGTPGIGVRAIRGILGRNGPYPSTAALCAVMRLRSCLGGCNRGCCVLLEGCQARLQDAWLQGF